MAISTTYLLLQSQIVDELGGRTDLLSALAGSGLTLSPVKNAIQSAIAKWERYPFYFNEAYDTAFFTTVNAQELYTSATTTKISTLANIYRLHITIAGVRYPMRRVAWQKIEDDSTSTTTGKPADFAYFAQQIRLFPIPDGAYDVAASYTQRLAALSADADTNVWTGDGFDLIRSEAKRILALEVLHNPELAQGFGQAVGEYFTALRDETARRGRFDWTLAEHDNGSGVARSM